MFMNTMINESGSVDPSDTIYIMRKLFPHNIIKVVAAVVIINY